MDIYSEIEGLCGAKNEGSVLTNGAEPTPRVNYITNLLDTLSIEYYLDKFKTSRSNGQEVYGYNIMIPGTSGRMVMAHHDIVNPKSDNANDNTASIICAIALKMKVPELGLAIVDGEEFGGIGSSYLSVLINDGRFGEIEWVLNLELSGIGGNNFFIGMVQEESALKNRILELFPDTPEIGVPFNDSMILRSNNIDSININPVPRLESGELDLSPLYLCHSIEDSLDKISKEDMKTYVEEILVPICS